MLGLQYFQTLANEKLFSDRHKSRSEEKEGIPMAKTKKENKINIFVTLTLMQYCRYS